MIYNAIEVTMQILKADSLAWVVGPAGKGTVK